MTKNLPAEARGALLPLLVLLGRHAESVDEERLAELDGKNNALHSGAVPAT
jgi:hypothetical protein